MTLSELQTMRDALLRAIASGHRSLLIGDKRIDYQDTSAMNAALAQVDREIQAAKGSGGAVLRTTFGQYGG